MGRRTIGSKLPGSFGLDDYFCFCDLCGVPQARSLMHYDTRGMLVCPIHGSGADSAELSELNAQGAAEWASLRASAPVRDRPGEYGPENIVPDYSSGYFDFFDPSLPPKLLVDLDPSDASFISVSGAEVLSLTNRVSGITWLPPSAAERPVYVSSWTNGNAALASGTNKYLLAREPEVSEALAGSDRGFAIFAVLALPASGDADVVFGFADSTATNRLFDVGFDSSERPRMIRRGNSGSTLIPTATGSIDASPHLVEWHYSGTALTIYVDGAAADPDAAACDSEYMSGDRCGLFCRPHATIVDFGNQALTCGKLLIYAGSRPGEPPAFLSDEFILSVRQPLLERFGIG